ncbi:hypothetical protein CBR_g30074 [Chara braunii]|uniref:Uncharacterized protein n=1 Tax=Chara braunii TaxID=69332 RepID=A0A388LBY2_CHABU|nr:hypothetical protein CBR_g30074 [Chara braunii]|eukprot:GBG79811.1 hypothetical protein CBR_g30074 [Chara braunii]
MGGSFYESLLGKGTQLTKGEYISLAIAIAIPIGQSLISTLFGGADEWYTKLKKPWFTPPNWAFPVVWMTLFTLMGIASWRIWLQGGFAAQACPLGLYAFQLVLNFFWSPIFFGLHLMGWALLEISILWGSVVACIVAFYKVDPIAGYLLVPYIMWLSLASLLNYSIWAENSLKVD